MPSYGAASFHAQQAAEKALKALLVRHQGSDPTSDPRVNRFKIRADKVGRVVAVKITDMLGEEVLVVLPMA